MQCHDKYMVRTIASPKVCQQGRTRLLACFWFSEVLVAQARGSLHFTVSAPKRPCILLDKQIFTSSYGYTMQNISIQRVTCRTVVAACMQKKKKCSTTCSSIGVTENQWRKDISITVGGECWIIGFTITTLGSVPDSMSFLGCWAASRDGSGTKLKLTACTREMVHVTARPKRAYVAGMCPA